MTKSKMMGKILLIPDFKGETIQIPIFSYTKWIVSFLLIFLLGFVSFTIYEYSFYQKKMHSLMNEQNVTTKSINEMSMDGIQTKRELMRLKYEIDCMDKFIASASTFDKDATTRLSIPFSSITFADYFKTNSSKYDQAHPASSAEIKVETKEDIAKNLKNSEERKATYKALMDVTPYGYPLIGRIINSSPYIEGSGIALISPVGSPIHATASGKIYQIISVNQDCSIIEIIHKEEKNKIVKTIYYFCYRPVIKIGQQIKKGQLIAYSGIHPTTGDNVFCYQFKINKLLIQPK